MDLARSRIHPRDGNRIASRRPGRVRPRVEELEGRIVPACSATITGISTIHLIHPNEKYTSVNADVVVHPGQTFTIGVTVDASCHSDTTGWDANLDVSYADRVSMDGTPLGFNGLGTDGIPQGFPTPYPFPNGAEGVVFLAAGAHTYQVHVRNDAPNDQIVIHKGVEADGPWMVVEDGNLNFVAAIPFQVAPADHLVFARQPSPVAPGEEIHRPVIVSAVDANGQVDTTFNGPITVALGANPGHGKLSGTLTVQARNGQATFTDLAIDKAGAGYTLVATEGDQSATSAKFNVAGDTLVFRYSSNIGTTFEPFTVQVKAIDARGQVDTKFAGTIRLGLDPNPSNAQLHGPVFEQASGGVAVFSGLAIDKSADGYGFAARLADGGTFDGPRFDVVTNTLAFEHLPPVLISGRPVRPLVKVRILDAHGHLNTFFRGTVRLEDSGQENRVEGTLEQEAVDGVATFPDLKFQHPISSFRFVAISSERANATSNAFQVKPYILEFRQLPVQGRAGHVLEPGTRVEAVDAEGNLIADFHGDVTLALVDPLHKAKLVGETKVRAVGGIADFSDLRISRAGHGYRLQATTEDGSATSAPFNVSGPLVGFKIEANEIRHVRIALSGWDPKGGLVSLYLNGRPVGKIKPDTSLDVAVRPGTAPLCHSQVVARQGPLVASDDNFGNAQGIALLAEGARNNGDFLQNGDFLCNGLLTLSPGNELALVTGRGFVHDVNGNVDQQIKGQVLAPFLGATAFNGDPSVVDTGKVVDIAAYDTSKREHTDLAAGNQSLTSLGGGFFYAGGSVTFTDTVTFDGAALYVNGNVTFLKGFRGKGFIAASHSVVMHGAVQFDADGTTAIVAGRSIVFDP